MKTLQYICAMILNENTAVKTAEFLLQIKAIKLQPTAPFMWASGWKSPIYCDNRLTLSYPPIRNFIRSEMASQIEEHFGKPDVIAGVATGAIAVGVLVAEILGLPFIYVRGKAKEHGRQNQIEGFLEKDQRVVVIEDLISTGGSSLAAVEALRAAGGKVLGMMGIFTYGFPVSVKNFEDANCELLTLSDYEHLLQHAAINHYVSEKELAILQQWRQEPSTWAGV
jgi:orotate phosphoribosyltransferase